MTDQVLLCASCQQPYCTNDEEFFSGLCPTCFMREKYGALKRTMAQMALRFLALTYALDQAGVQYSFDPERGTCQVKTGAANVSVEVAMEGENP